MVNLHFNFNEFKFINEFYSFFNIFARPVGVLPEELGRLRLYPLNLIWVMPA
jgi:hypothetical protein